MPRLPHARSGATIAAPPERPSGTMIPTDFVRLEPGADGGARLGFDETRASAFAKGVAGDFNPLHDPGDRRFCVPGDLLFATLVEHYGLHRETSIGFANMVDADAALTLPALAAGAGAVHVADARGREALVFFVAGDPLVGNEAARRGARAIVLECVRFSGRTFPDILVPLMRERGVMVNPERPLIIYKDMAIRIDAGVALDGVAGARLVDGAHELAVNGRKGTAILRFEILEGDGEADDGPRGRRLGEGEKHFVLGGLREHGAEAMAGIVAEYATRRARWAETRGEGGATGPSGAAAPAGAVPAGETR